MITGRFLRRRTMDLLVKVWEAYKQTLDLLGQHLQGVILTTVIMFFVHMTSSHPRGGYSLQKGEATVLLNEPIVKINEIPTDNEIGQVDPWILNYVRFGAREEFTEFSTISKDEKRENAEVAPIDLNSVLEDGKKINEAQILATSAPTKHIPTKKSRKGEFYENVLIHFDLKGAPPKVPYFLEVLRLVAKGGATGILLEWEDMFPWTGALEKFRNTDAYSMDDVKTILNECRSLQLDIIPLVQTFGHVEWILKFEEMRKYRENDAYPNVLCLGSEDGVKLVKEAIKQITDVHKEYGIPYFHIGADEAFEFGVCPESVEWIKKNGAEGGKQMLALAHLKNIALYVKGLTGDGTTVLAWHDMLKDFQSHLIKKLELGSFIEPVVWDYSENIITMNDHSFATLAENFPTIWASSAYKGANFPSATLSDVRHYETNNRNWVTTKKNQQSKFRNPFHGIIITGWQRYDHLAGLCEILPVGTPSMMLNLQIALNAPNMDQEATRNQAAKILGCASFNVAGTNIISNKCSFKGFEVYAMYQSQVQQSFRSIDDELGQNHHLMGWANRYNRKYNISQNWYHREMLNFVQNLVNRCDQVERSMRAALSELFFDNTVDEFVYENLGQMSEKLHNYLDEIQRLDKLRSWPKRHFPLGIAKH